MNKFKVNTSGINEVGVVEVQGGKIHCTVDEFIDMHSEGCIYNNGDTFDVYYIEDTFLEVGGKKYLPYWESSDNVCFLSFSQTQRFKEEDIFYETSFEFELEPSSFPVPLLELPY